jgi:hypothetical protein
MRLFRAEDEDRIRAALAQVDPIEAIRKRDAEWDGASFNSLRLAAKGEREAMMTAAIEGAIDRRFLLAELDRLDALLKEAT